MTTPLYSIRRNGHGLENRVVVKAFRYAHTMHRFLNKQYDNSWQIMTQPVKSGVYFEQYDSRAGASKLISTKELIL